MSNLVMAFEVPRVISLCLLGFEGIFWDVLELGCSVVDLDMIVGPSGYGLPVTQIRDITERELTLMVPDDKSIPL